MRRLVRGQKQPEVYATEQLREITKEVHGKAPEFSCEIPGYVAAVAIHHGWLILPRPLEFAQKALFGLAGMEEHSVKWQASRPLIDVGRKAIDMFELGEFADIDELIGDDFAASFIGRIVGAYLFDPTTV